jgi:hypothetical protein
MPSRVLAALARAARAGASTETLAPYARAAKAVLADVARGRTRVGTGTGTGTREAFAEAERQVDEVVRVLSPGPLVAPQTEAEKKTAEEAMRAAAKRWRDAQEEKA